MYLCSTISLFINMTEEQCMVKDSMMYGVHYTDANNNLVLGKLKEYTISVKYKKLVAHAITPTYAHETDAGMDLYAADYHWDADKAVWRYQTGIAFEIPVGYVGLLFPRSSICNVKVDLTNCVGVIDAGYRGDVGMVFRDVDSFNSKAPYKVGERIGQIIIIPIPKIKLLLTESLSNSDRGSGGYGSSGK